MRVLRTNKDSVMAMLEAFVHDPLINWRLLNTAEASITDAINAGRCATFPMELGHVVQGSGRRS